MAEIKTETHISDEKQLLKEPSSYQVILLNDDFTPMDFVVMVLQQFFSKDEQAAIQIMLKIHHEGQSVCGVYSRDIAATKVHQVTHYAQSYGHPLHCTMEAL